MFLARRSNRIYYLFYFDELGKRHKVSTKSSRKSEALSFLRQFKRDEHERKVKLQRTSLMQFSEDYFKYSASVHTAKTQETYRSALDELIRIIGDVPLHRIGVQEVERFLSVKKQEASGWTARKYYISLASAFKTAQHWNCIMSNPFRLVEKPKVPQLLPQYFQNDEFKKLIGTVDDIDFRELCLCAVMTGLRLSELTALQWTNIDLGRGVICVQSSDGFTTKNRKVRVVPMNHQLWELLTLRSSSAVCELVFHRRMKRLTKDYVSKRFKRYVRRAAVNPKLHFHSLRHTFATWLVQDGVSLYEVQKLLGHSSIAVTQVYSHLQPEQLHATVNRIVVSLN